MFGPEVAKGESPCIPQSQRACEDPSGGARTETIAVYEDRTIAESEAKLVLEATRGGVQRLEDGRIARTYESSEAPPSQCPT